MQIVFAPGEVTVKQLGILDSAFINLEQPNTPQHVGGLGIYDPSTAPGGFVRFKQVIENFEQRLNRRRCEEWGVQSDGLAVQQGGDDCLTVHSFGEQLEKGSSGLDSSRALWQARFDHGSLRSRPLLQENRDRVGHVREEISQVRRYVLEQLECDTRMVLAESSSATQRVSPCLWPGRRPGTLTWSAGLETPSAKRPGLWVRTTLAVCV